MKLETIDNRKNWVTIAVFIVVGVILNLPSFAALFNIYLPYSIVKYINFAPFLFVILIVFQRKNSSVEVDTPITWTVKKRKNFFVNTRKLTIRYIILGVAVIVFFVTNVFSNRGGISDENLRILIGFMVIFGAVVLYQRFRTNFTLGYCNKGVVFGYPSKITLAEWKSISDFLPDDETETIIAYFDTRLSIHKAILKPENDYAQMKALFVEHLAYKNVSKLLTDEK